MATVVIADRRRLFEYFTSMKDEANGLNSPNLTSNIDKVISLWTKMTISESEQQRKVKERVHCMQVSRLFPPNASTLPSLFQHSLASQAFRKPLTELLLVGRATAAR